MNCNKNLYLIMTLLLSDYINSEDFSEQVKNYLPLVKEIGTDCLNGFTTSVYLPYGKGEADASVISITDHTSTLSCTIQYFTPEKNPERDILLILVLEFQLYLETPRYPTDSLTFCNNLIGSIIVQHGNPAVQSDLCKEKLEATLTGRQSDLNNEIYMNSFASEEVDVKINIQKMTGSIKITATSARALQRHGTCNPRTELNCELKTGAVCLSSILTCDGNINCGTVDQFDEDPKFCDIAIVSALWVTAAYGVLTTLIGVFLVIQLLRVCVPTASDNFFIFNEDEDNKLILTSQVKLPGDVVYRSKLDTAINILPSDSEELKDVQESDRITETDPLKPAKKQRFETPDEESNN